MGHRYRSGECVIYRKTKVSVHPGPRAKNVSPAQMGDDYWYQVDKFWIVERAQDNSVTLKTRRGKRHTVPADDPNLRPAHWWERWFFRNRFPAFGSEETSAAATPGAEGGPFGTQISKSS